MYTDVSTNNVLSMSAEVFKLFEFFKQALTNVLPFIFYMKFAFILHCF